MFIILRAFIKCNKISKLFKTIFRRRKAQRRTDFFEYFCINFQYSLPTIQCVCIFLLFTAFYCKKIFFCDKAITPYSASTDWINLYTQASLHIEQKLLPYEKASAFESKIYRTGKISFLVRLNNTANCKNVFKNKIPNFNDYCVYPNKLFFL